MRVGALATVLAAGLAVVAGSGVLAQSVADVVQRDRLIADQENLLNTYRCLFGVDVEVVPGGCPDPVVVSPGVAPQSPTQHDIEVRDGLIQRQEALLNIYRCRFNIDTEIVPGGCGEPGADVPTEVPVTGSGDDSDDDLYYYEDVFPDDYEGERPSGPIFNSINRLRRLGIFEGTECGPKRFCPDDPVDGRVFATWLARILDGRRAPDPVGRLGELGVAVGCGTGWPGLCPNEALRRDQMATFVVRALDLPVADPIGFWDVDEDNRHLDNIDRLVGSEINDGCSEIRFTPLHFCPNQLVSRGELAKILSEVVDYIEAREIIKIDPNSRTDNSVNLSVSYNEDSWTTTTTWNNPSNSRGGVSHYVLQWRPTWTGFNYRQYEVVRFKASGGYRVEIQPTNYTNNAYSVRVITVYNNGDRAVTNESKVPSNKHQLRDLIENKAIGARGDEQPWLVDTWRHLNGMDTDITNGDDNSVGFSSVAGSHNRLKQTFVIDVSINTSRGFDDGRLGVIAHELGHAYTMTSGVTKNDAPIAIGYIYLHLLNREQDAAGSNTRWCAPSELYADLAQMAFAGSYPDFDPRVGIPFSANSSRYNSESQMIYWNACKFNLDQKTSERVAREIVDITKSVFVDQKMPQWFYDRYQLGGGSIDLDKIWSDISNNIARGDRTLNIVLYGLQNEFGGYCSIEDIYKFSRGEIDSLDTPWRDASGCPDEEVQS